MSTKYIFSGIVNQGRFIPDDAPAYAVRLSKLDGQRVRVTVVRPSMKSTQPQNAYYRATVLPTIAEWAGYDATYQGDLDAVHAALKLRVFGSEGRKGLEVEKSHADYDVEQLSEFLEKVLRWTAEAGLYIPEASGGTE